MSQKRLGPQRSCFYMDWRDRIIALSEKRITLIGISLMIIVAVIIAFVH